MPKSPIDDTAPPFEGFDAGLWKFLRGLKKNNNKEWFEDHRDDYESFAREPAKSLIAEMAAEFERSKLPFIANPKRSLFRINRDIRFSKDKSPYKTNIGLAFPVVPETKDEWCGMYLHLDPAESFIGGGVHMPMPPQLKRIRAKIAKDPKAFEKLIADKKFKKEFPKGITGEQMKRMPLGYSEDHPASEWLKHKEFVFSAPLTPKEIGSPKLAKLIARKCEAASGVLRWLA